MTLLENIRANLGTALLALALLLPVPLPAAPALIMPRASESLLLDITVAGERVLAVGEQGHILYSDDGGRRWLQAEVPTRQMLTAVHFPTPQRGWAVGHDGLILATLDGGVHWVLQRDGLADQQRINRERLRKTLQRQQHAQQALLEAASVGEREVLLEAMEELALDVEDAREVLAEPVHAPPLLDVFFLDALRGYAVGAFNTLLQTTDGGVSWLLQSQRLENPDEYHLNAVTGSAGGELWIAGEGGILQHSADAGSSWKTLPGPYRGSWFGIVKQPDADALLVFGLRGHVFRSDDAGSNWQQVPVPTTRSLAGGYFVNADYVLLVGAVGTLLVSTDGGSSFREHILAQRAQLSAVATSKDRVVMVGQGGIHEAFPFGGVQ